MAFYGEPQWAVVGDTFPVGCAWGDSIVYRATSFDNNPDGKDSRYKYVPVFLVFPLVLRKSVIKRYYKKVWYKKGITSQYVTYDVYSYE